MGVQPRERVSGAVTISSTLLRIPRNALRIPRNALRWVTLTTPGICKAIEGSKALSHSYPPLRPTGQEDEHPSHSHFTDEKTELSKVKPRACPR